VSTGAALAAGAGVGLLLFGALARERPALPGLRALGRSLVLFPSVCAEEVVWRLGALGLLLPVAGPLAALSVSSVGFALVHWRQAGAKSLRVHLATGAVFGSAFLVTGVFVAAIAAHASYNLCVAAAVERGPP
jgi:membrane protease YdiL (CAAX protease family)